MSRRWRWFILVVLIGAAAAIAIPRNEIEGQFASQAVNAGNRFEAATVFEDPGGG